MIRKVVCAAIWLCLFPTALWKPSNGATLTQPTPAETQLLQLESLQFNAPQSAVEANPLRKHVEDRPRAVTGNRRRYVVTVPARRERFAYLQNFESLAPNPDKPMFMAPTPLPAGMTLVKSENTNLSTDGHYAAKGRIPVPLNPADKAVFNKEGAGTFTVRFTAYQPSSEAMLRMGNRRIKLEEKAGDAELQITALGNHHYQIEHRVAGMDGYVIESGTTIIDDIQVRRGIPRVNLAVSEGIYVYHPVFAK
ncbi:hypothetical protein [Acanthopleuribacter pedis]|uniref:Uncharacterized protein n=1 Tax=Acanthopleuribacter pedis TaxID=442870 RepID=A0A8J7Q7X6_9BACT|nr:hypothetical protein [Acanthopleuribacter pedis]MBO1322402.1 hypothetical protein [Acanthopleuribacter pedis]